MDKKVKKLIANKCEICGEDNYSLLDCHRINPGSKYTKWGTVVLCANCHRKVHAGDIEIIGKFSSTAGNLLHYKENKEERWIPVS